MRCRVTRMRRQGVDVPRHELRSAAYWTGELTVLDIRDDGVGRHIRVARHMYQSGDRETVAVLYEPRLIWMADERFTLAGFERVLEGERLVHYAQSWLCAVEPGGGV